MNQFILHEKGYPELEIHANTILFDKEENFIKFKKPIIHSFDKDKVFFMFQYLSAYLNAQVLNIKRKKFRKNVLLMGDMKQVIIKF